MRLRHPRDRPPSQVSVNGARVPVDDDGTFEPPEGTSDSWAQQFAAGHGVELEEILVTETCDAIQDDGEVCGRELPCQYHSDEEE